MKRLILWGMGAIYNQMKNTVSWYELKGQISVIAVTAKAIPTYNSLDGYPIVPADKVKDLEFDYIVILSDKYFSSIMKEAMSEYGIHRNRFLKYQVLQIPGLNFDEYVKLKESNLSIVSNNCWGGMVYHTLGLECLSPFRNLFLLDRDYLKLIQNLKWYMQCELRLDHWGVDDHSGQRYPVLVLDDIEIHCNHASDPEQAMIDWKRRTKRFNFENVLVEMYTESIAVAESFCGISEYNKKICFVPFEDDYKNNFVYLKLLPGQKEFWETVNSNASIGKNGLEYDIVKLLLYGQISYRMK